MTESKSIYSSTYSAHTFIFNIWLLPYVVAKAVSIALRPLATTTRPMDGILGWAGKFNTLQNAISRWAKLRRTPCLRGYVLSYIVVDIPLSF